LVVVSYILSNTLETTRGDITLELFEQRAPRTVENFLGLATGDREWSDPDTGETRTDSLYEGTIFHRIIPDFMIQGGDPEGTGRGGPGYTFDDEFHEDLNHDGAGVLSMANRGPNTNGSQFFITLDSQPHLNGKHAVFGHVVDGMDTVEEIGSVPTDRDDKPMQDIKIEALNIER
jgi:peptidyl-prolyl cis-trans isomerase A (cyclophilin A)